MANGPSGEGVIERLIRVLETFDPDHTAQTASQISRRAALPASTGHRVVAELTAAGLLERDDEGRARVGMRLWELATRGSLALGLRQAALPAMERVQSAVRQHTQLAVLEHDTALFLERLSHPEAGANITRIAGRLPLHASSSGLVLLAHAPREVIERVLASPLPAVAPDTITDSAVLRRRLSEIRRLGYAVSPGSVETVSTGIAVPILDSGTVVAALSVILPRGSRDETRTLVLLRDAAADIATTLAQARLFR
ncbi:MAG: IclR family transcriptional regulator [Pseudolysinimonas sp.]|uniref:IclR family transcriptional regulator n=1 Tax=Pseudolysinimonas sp. TaxID=2680009 RepID=UPI003267ECA3